MKFSFSALFVVSILTLFLFAGCQKEINWDSVNGTVKNDPVTASVTGLIIDENDQPMRNVIIRTKAGNQTSTDSNGYFRFNKITLDKYSSLITAEAPGYFKGYRVFAASGKGLNFIKIRLLRKDVAGSFNSINGGTISINGHSILFQANSIVLKSNGSSYAGTVKVLIADIDPTIADFPEIIPGSLNAVDSNGNQAVLKSFGMLNVELEGAAGEKLQLKENKPATITYKIPNNLLSQAPDKIPMWYMDETDGIWKQENTAIKQADKYSGQVKHFTPYNFDIPAFQRIRLEMTLKDLSGNPLPNALVRVDAANVAGTPLTFTYFTYSDSTGYALLIVPANSPLTINVLDECYSPVYTRSEGAKSTDTNLGSINLDYGVNKLVVGGTIKKCNGQNVTNGYVTIYLENKFYSIPIQANGQFSATFTRCFGTSITITTVDLEAQQSGNPNVYSLPFNLSNLSLTACGNQLQNYMVTTIAGNSSSGYVDGAVAIAKFFNPHGVAIDASGNLFVADADNNCIRKITPQGVVSTFAGNGTAGYVDATGTAARFFGITGIVFDNNGNLFVTDQFNNCVRKITPGGVVTTYAGDRLNPGYLDGPAASAQFTSLQGLTINSNGDIFVTDNGCNCIRKIASSGIVSTVAGSNSFGYSDGPANTAKFATPMGISLDATGNIYVADWANHRIRKINSVGIVSTVAGDGTPGYLDGPALNARFQNPYDMAFDASGNMLIADGSNHKIRKLTPAGSVSTVAGSTVGNLDGLGTASKLFYPYKIVLDASGAFYVTETHDIRKLTPQ
ncbi:MAG: hypothetical protein HZA79_03055 [Sphingobacteriales bacterium]|nr:hypothetical protein [Sphingobacteriales bacterium]